MYLLGLRDNRKRSGQDYALWGSEKGKVQPRLGKPRETVRTGLENPPPGFDPRTVASSYTDYAISLRGFNEIG
jgi:hypothetical protein